MGASGEDLMLSPAARRFIPVSFECKNVEKLNFWAAYDQACKNSNGFEPVLIAKRNRKEPLAVVDARHYVELLRIQNEYDSKVRS